MTLRTKFVLLLAAFSAFMVGSVASASWAIGLYLNASFVQFTTASDLIKQMDRLQDDLITEVHKSVSAIPPPETCIDARLTSMLDGVMVQLDGVSPPGQEPSLGQLLGAARDHLAGDYALLRADLVVADAQVPSLLASFDNQTVLELQHALDRIKLLLSRQVRSAATHADVVQRNVLMVLLANGVLAVILAVVGSVMVQRWVARPIQALRDASVRFAEGDLSHRVPVYSHDELGLLSEQTNDMAKRLAESRRKLVERERMAAVGELCSAVAHGIRNPLSSIASSAELILSHGPSDEPTQSRVRDVLAECARLSQRVSRLLDYARPTRAAEEVIQLDELLDQAATEMAPFLRARSVQLRKQFSSEKLMIRGDREILVNAVIELITNAAEQPSDDPVIVLGCFGRDGGAVVEVRDNGPGFSKHAKPRVFDLFYTTKANGNGIGLSSVRKAVELHDGKVYVENANGGGAMVRFTLPTLS